MVRLTRGVAVAAMLSLMIVACGVSQHHPTAAATPQAVPVAEATEPAAAATCDPLFPPGESEFPQGFDYPQSSATIRQWITGAGRDGHRTRRHAYCLFAGLNQFVRTTSTPVWRFWGTSTQAFPNQYNKWRSTAADGRPLTAQDVQPATINEARNQAGQQAGGVVGAISNPAPIYAINQAVAGNPQYRQCLQPDGKSLKDGPTFQNNGDIMIAAVSYNKAALSGIRISGMNDAATLDSRLPAQPSSPATNAGSLSPTAIVLKVMLWPVKGDASPSTVTALPIWDWDANKPGSPADGQYAG